MKSFSTAQGKPDRYDEALTLAYLDLIANRVGARHGTTWSAFAAANPDLLVWPTVNIRP